jgi:hypothetical protein
MYSSLEQFQKDAFECGKQYYSDGSLQSRKIRVAYNIYKRTSQGTKLFDYDGNPIAFGLTIVGRLALHHTVSTKTGETEIIWETSDPEFPSIDQIMKENLGTVDESDEVAGSILDSSNWSLLANDAWLLGGLHALTEFHFASPLRWKNLWDDGEKRMSITAREVLGITAHGYKILRPNNKLEAVAVCQDDVLSRHAT